ASTTKSQLEQDITNAGESQVQAVNNAGVAQVQAVQQEGADQVQIMQSHLVDYAKVDDVSELRGDLSKLINEKTATYSQSGFNPIDFTFENGKSYTVENISESTIIQIFAINGSDALLTVGKNSTRSITYTGETTKIKIYCNSSVQVTVTIRETGSFCYETNKAINLLMKENQEIDENIEMLKNALVLVKSKNYFDINNAILSSSINCFVSPKVKVNEGDKYYLSAHNTNPAGLTAFGFWGVHQYDANGNRTTTENWIKEYIVPEGIVEVQFVVAQTNYQYIMVEKDIQTLKWEEYFEPYYKCVDEEAREEIEVLKNNQNSEEFVLPSALYGVVGKETNIYYQNILNHSSMNMICGCDIGGKIANTERFRDRLIWTPSANGKITDTITCYKKSWNDAILSKSIPFISAPTDSGNNEIKVVTIGDSKIAYGEVIGYLFDMFENDNHTLTLLGSRYDNNNSGDTRHRHDGYGGWSSYDFAYENKNGLNPFYNADYTDSQYGTHFDFSHYMTNLGYSDVDYVFINLGTNDFGQSLDSVIHQTNAMIDSIHSYDANIKIAIGLNEPVYSKKMEWRTRNEWFYKLNKRKIETYDNRVSENIFVLPLYPSIDSVNDYDNPVVQVPLSYADSVVGTNKTREYHSDGIHESKVGFYKYANCMYSFIKCVESGLVN
ncbi:MAG: SGNH/GDSL hydrolase family protein, partial [Bacteroidaceae bacterium]